MNRAQMLAWPCALLASMAASVTLAAADYPGLPPHCWTEARNVHAQADYSELLNTRLELTRVARIDLESTVASPNGGYRFAQRNLDRQRDILIDAEQPQLLQLRISEAMALEPRWINEKLLYLRIWWGAIAMTDLIVDVEAGNIIHTEHATHGQIAMEQAREGCAELGGCEPCGVTGLLGPSAVEQTL